MHYVTKRKHSENIESNTGDAPKSTNLMRWTWGVDFALSSVKGFTSASNLILEKRDNFDKKKQK